MGNITTMAVFVWTLNILIFLSQAAMIDINPTEPVIYYNTSGTVLSEYSTQDGLNMPNSENIQSELDPSSSGEVEENTGVFFIDIFASVKSWIQNKIDYIVAIVLGPYNIINSIPGLPKAFVNSISLLWYGVSLLLLLAFMFGREN